MDEALDLEVEPLAAPALKWAAWQGAVGGAAASSINIGDNAGSGGQALGAFATGDLYIIMVAVTAAAGLANPITISGSGFTKIIDAQSTDTNTRYVVWWKNAGAGETGIYTITFGGASAQSVWSAWNSGQSAFIDAWSGFWSNNTGSIGRIPGCAPTSSQSLLLTNWFMFAATPTTWVLPGGLTTLFNVSQTASPPGGWGASATKVLAAAGMTPDLTATNATSQQYGGFQIAIASASPPGGGGGTSPLKWIAMESTQAGNATSTSVVVGQTNVGQALGSFATGDLYVVAVTTYFSATTPDPGPMSISGTGWTNIVQIAPIVDTGNNIIIRMAAWAKNAGSGETGIYTISWTNLAASGWTAWNYGQTTVDVAAGQGGQSTTSCVAPSVTPTQANDILLAYWSTIARNFTAIPATLTERANIIQIFANSGMASGDMMLSSMAPTAALTATASAACDFTAFQLAIKQATGTIPAVPTGLTATAVSSSQINLSWTASSGATSYNVLRGGTQVGTSGGTNFSNTGLTASTSYTYTVQAVSAGGTSASSLPASATTFAAGATLFPAFTPLIPPPLIGQGGGPAPTFPPVPPNTAPVPIPPGVLVGPAITLPTVIVGKALIIFGTGSATAPTVVSWFPSFTTTFPSPTFVVSNVWTVPTFAGGVWTSTLPARTATTTCVPIGGWGLPGPSGSGPGPPSYPNPPGAGKPFMVMGEDVSVPPAVNENASSGDTSATAEIPRRRRRASA